MFYEKLAVAISAFALAAGVVNAARRNWTSEAREPVHHIFTNVSDRTLDVDDVNGTVEVTGDAGNTIRVEGEKVMRAADAQALDRARKEVTLDINEKDGIAQLYVNGPFRNNGHSSENHGFHAHSDDQDYEVTYNLTIHVPRATELRLRDTNGEIKTGETSGKFDIRGVNGGLTMTGAAGSGTTSTVNGRLSVAFKESPKGASEFRSVNGAIDALFPSSLSADLRFKTLNGQVYTDFDAKALADSPGSTERRNGKFVYASNRSSSVRIGSGGPELNFETVNGDIRIRKEQR
jgi:DUF4097 and DUF4098 domain-containing protein YvlB